MKKRIEWYNITVEVKVKTHEHYTQTSRKQQEQQTIIITNQPYCIKNIKLIKMTNTITLDSSVIDELNFDDLLGDTLFHGTYIDLDYELPPEMKEMGDVCVESLPTSATLAAEEKVAARFVI